MPQKHCYVQRAQITRSRVEVILRNWAQQYIGGSKSAVIYFPSVSEPFFHFFRLPRGWTRLFGKKALILQLITTLNIDENKWNADLPSSSTQEAHLLVLLKIIAVISDIESNLASSVRKGVTWSLSHSKLQSSFFALSEFKLLRHY